MAAVAPRFFWRRGRRSPGTAALHAGLVLALLAAVPSAPQAAPGNASPSARPAFFTLSGIKSGVDGSRPSVASSPPGRDSTAITDVSAAEPFDLTAFRAPESLIWTKWRALRDRMASEATALEHCRAADDACTPAARNLLGLINAATQRPAGQRLHAVNAAVNAVVRYASDPDRHGLADHWSSAMETLAAGEGDCEDYAIAKYAVLQAAGFPEDRLRILLVRDRAVGLDHAVLAAKADDRWHFMDNRWDTVLDEARAARFEPLFGLRGDRVTLFAAPYVRQMFQMRGPEALQAGTGEQMPTRGRR
jgi:predicted transglutaminase-like cysteine proteinase